MPLLVGPFGPPSSLRAAIDIDPDTAELTITTDPLPHDLEGIPADLRQINTVIDRPGFMFNPTNCTPLSSSRVRRMARGRPGTRSESERTISSHFQVGSCRALEFAPNF